MSHPALGIASVRSCHHAGKIVHFSTWHTHAFGSRMRAMPSALLAMLWQGLKSPSLRPQFVHIT